MVGEAGFSSSEENFVFIKTAKYGENTVINSERALAEAQEKVKSRNRVVGCIGDYIPCL